RSAGRDVAGVIDGAIIAIGFGLLLTYQRLTGADIQVAAIAGAWAVLFVLVMTRMAGLVRGIERSEAARRHLLDQTMHAAEQERTQIAAELETIVYRVTQEALLDVTRHANAKRLWLESRPGGGSVVRATFTIPS